MLLSLSSSSWRGLRRIFGIGQESSPAAMSPQTSRRHARSVARAMCWMLVADVVCCIAIVGWSRNQAYEAEMRQGTVAGLHLVQAATDHADSTLNMVAWTLDSVADRVETDGVTGAAADRLRQFLLSRVQQKDSPLEGLLVSDASGRWVIATGNDAGPAATEADSAYFHHHRSHPGRGAHIGQPSLSRSSGQRVITVSRRIDDREGQFAGIVRASIPVQHFQRYYKRMSLGAQGMVTLATTDGAVVARTPARPGGAGDHVRAAPWYRHVRDSGKEQGAVMLTSTVDGIERLHSFQRSARYPLIVNAALGKDEILAEWWRVTWQECVAVASVMAAAYLIWLWVIGQVRVRERLEATLYSTQQALETQNAALERLAHTDGLTGLHNRRHLDERMAAEIARAAREGTSLSLIMMDVDFFKRYNDRYGHAAGDDCLRTVARVLAATVNRPADLAARFGGEEFAVLLPNTTAEGARQLAEAICRGVHATGLEHGASDFGTVTISAGVATAIPAPGDEARMLVEKADAALYQAKEAGRNTVR